MKLALPQLFCVSFARKVSHPQFPHVKKGHNNALSSPPTGLQRQCDLQAHLPLQRQPFANPELIPSVDPVLPPVTDTRGHWLWTTPLLETLESPLQPHTLGREATAASGQRKWPLGFWLFPLRRQLAAGGLARLAPSYSPPHRLPGCSVSPSWPQRRRFPWALSCFTSHLLRALTSGACWPHTFQLRCLQPKAPGPS